MSSRPLSPEHYTAEEVVRLLNLAPLDMEGGFFRRVGESELVLPGSALPSIYAGARRAYSTIYALFTPDGFSALHRLRSDEIWCFHAGDPLESLRLHPDGEGQWVHLGLDLAAGDLPQDMVEAHTWQGTRLATGGRWALVSCVVAPEFAWDDFELGAREALEAAFPAWAEGIRALTRTQPPKGRR
ncbi:MAG TPA: cupin domain-containing protein [Opitutaceae bacterium]